MALVRTFTNRGKRALTLEELKPNGVYAVRFVLTPELAEEWNINEHEQWAIVMLDSMCKVRRHWNLTQPNQWSNSSVDVTSLKLFKTSVMERQFATNTEQMERYNSMYDDLLKQRSELMFKVKVLLQTKFVRVCRSLGLIKWEN